MKGDIVFECFTLQPPKPLEVNAPDGYFFLSSAPCPGEGGAVRVVVTWRKALNRLDPGPAVPATATPIYRRPAKKKAGKRGPKR